MNQIADMFAQVVAEALVVIYGLTGDLGWAIIIFTIVLRALLVPLTLPSLKAKKRMDELKPEIDQLKAQFGGNKQGFQLAQLELYKKHNVNPLAGCLPQLLQIAVLIGLYHAFVTFLKQTEVSGVQIDQNFFWLDLSKPDQLFVLPVLATVTQLVLSLMVAPAAEVSNVIPEKTKDATLKKANEREEDLGAMAATMQKQMLFTMPFLTGVIAVQFPSGVVLYWIITTIFSTIQQYFVSGLGGLVTYSQRLLQWVKREPQSRDETIASVPTEVLVPLQNESFKDVFQQVAQGKTNKVQKKNTKQTKKNKQKRRHGRTT